MSKHCKHNWVEDPDYYVEQCTGAVCTKCGKLGCYCQVVREAGYPRGTELQRLKQQFFKLVLDELQ